MRYRQLRCRSAVAPHPIFIIFILIKIISLNVESLALYMKNEGEDGFGKITSSVIKQFLRSKLET